MDIRNIKEEVPPTREGTELQNMYSLGIQQFEGYRQIEKLPEAPLDVNNPYNQVILKDFIGRVIEELMEGYESTSEVVKICHKWGWNIDQLTEDEYTQVLNHLQNANEEQVDALGFYFTLFLFANIAPEDILSWGTNHVMDYSDFKVNNLKDVMTLGISMVTEGTIGLVNRFNMIDEDHESVKDYTPGFNTLSEASHEEEKILLFNVVYELNIARNLLKCRPWKQTQVMTKELDFQYSLVKAFYLYMGFLGIQGFTPYELFMLFFKKQRLNIWRQKSNY